jgi:hypothetical protein
MKHITSTWYTLSDGRIKDNIKIADIKNSYDIIKKLKLKNFNYKKEVINNDSTYIGLISQDVENILPICVENIYDRTINDLKILNLDQINKHLIGCVQFLTKKVETLEKDIKILKNNKKIYASDNLINKKSHKQ